MGLITSGVIFGTATPASAADDGPFDLFALKSPGLAVDTGSCRYVYFTARTDADPNVVESVEAEVDIWNNGKYLSSVSLSSEDGTPNRLTGRYYYCPMEGVGVMRLGPSEVDYYDYDYNSDSFIDSSRGSADIRQATKTALDMRRSGKTRTFVAHPKYFAAGWATQWTRYPEGITLRLQRRSASGNGSWDVVARDKTNGSGEAVLRTSANKQFQYRVTASGSENSRPLRSRVITG